jgi:hypothetical protein
MNHDIEFASFALKSCGQSVNVGLLLDVAREILRCAQFISQLFNRRLRALVLVGEQQRRALAHECLRDRVRDAPFVPHTQNDRCLSV